MLSDSVAGDVSGGSYAGWVSDPTRHQGLMRNTKLVFPGKSTQEPQCGGRSSYEADSRLPANSVFLWLFVSEKGHLNPAEFLLANSATQKQLDPPNTSLFSRAT